MNEYKKQILSTILELQMEYNTFHLMIFGDEVRISDDVSATRVYKDDRNEVWDGFLQLAEMMCKIS